MSSFPNLVSLVPWCEWKYCLSLLAPYWLPNFGFGNERVLFSNSVSGVLGQISLNGSLRGEQQVNFGGNNYYELTAVPEPSTWIAGGLLLGLLAYRERRRFKRD